MHFLATHFVLFFIIGIAALVASVVSPLFIVKGRGNFLNSIFVSLFFAVVYGVSSILSAVGFIVYLIERYGK